MDGRTLKKIIRQQDYNWNRKWFKMFLSTLTFHVSRQDKSSASNLDQWTIGDKNILQHVSVDWIDDGPGTGPRMRPAGFWTDDGWVTVCTGGSASQTSRLAAYDLTRRVKSQTFLR